MATRTYLIFGDIEGAPSRQSGTELMPDDQSAPDRHWSYPKPHEPPIALFWAALLLLIAAWTAFEHSYWISMALFLWGAVGAIWGNRNAYKNYKIAKLQFDLARSQHWLDGVQETIMERRQAIQDLEPKIDAIRGQTKWSSLKEFLTLCGGAALFVLTVWAIDYWLWEGSRLRSWLYGVIDYAINHLIPWAVPHTTSG